VYQPGETIRYEFATHAATGAAVDADAIPTVVLLRNNAASGETVTVTKAATGLYIAAVAIPEDWAAGDTVQLRISAAVAAIAANRHSEAWILRADPAAIAAIKLQTDKLNTLLAEVTV
jgi:hypothetical protein